MSHARSTASSGAPRASHLRPLQFCHPAPGRAQGMRFCPIRTCNHELNTVTGTGSWDLTLCGAAAGLAVGLADTAGMGPCHLLCSGRSCSPGPPAWAGSSNLSNRSPEFLFPSTLCVADEGHGPGSFFIVGWQGSPAAERGSALGGVGASPPPGQIGAMSHVPCLC